MAEFLNHAAGYNITIKLTKIDDATSETDAKDKFKDLKAKGFMKNE